MAFVDGGVNSRGLREGEALTLMTTANTIGPRTSPMFIPESMVVTRFQLWIHEGTWAGGEAKEDGATKGGRGTSGEGRLLCPRMETYMRYPR
jgi:hypothetical protein